VAAILELDEHLQRSFTIFEAAPQVGSTVSICAKQGWVQLHMNVINYNYMRICQLQLQLK